jgi:hypothetical protein
MVEKLLRSIVSIPITPSFETSVGIAAVRAKVTLRRSVGTRSAAVF